MSDYHIVSAIVGAVDFGTKGNKIILIIARSAIFAIIIISLAGRQGREEAVVMKLETLGMLQKY